MYTSVYNRECWQQFIIQTRSIERKMTVEDICLCKAIYIVYSCILNEVKMEQGKISL